MRRSWRRFRQRLRQRQRLLKPRIQSVQGRLRRQRVIHVLHIGKTGGSALKVAIRGDEWGVQNVYQRAAPGARIIFHAHGIDLSLIPKGDDVVFLLRDPVTRYVSGFLARLREGYPRFDRPWRPREQRAFERFPTPDALAVALSSDDPGTRKAAEDGMRRIRHVRNHLSDWLGSPELLRRRRDDILLVGWQETLVADFERLRELIDLPQRCELPEDPRKANRAPDELPTDLSETGEANIRAWYSDDYAIIDTLVELGLTRIPDAD